MKRLLFLFFFIVALSSSSELKAQCNADSYSAACLAKLTDGFKFLKNYKIDGQAGQRAKVEYSYVFTKGTKYRILICTEGAGPDGIVLNIFDQNRNPIGGNKVSGQILSSVELQAGATGIYYLQYTFEGSKGHCASSTIGFKN
ncbi:MAG: hypothetical protein FJZ78_09375 [Bacteroidetes bacterium]|nr:hypothetical protein [Bacteroidota bacterium]